MLQEEPIFSGFTEDGLVCLTIDDGPSEHGPEIARMLFSADVSATFFFNKDDSLEHSASCTQLLPYDQYWKYGHYIADHTSNHSSVVSQDAAYFVGSRKLMSDLSYLSGGPELLRPPYGVWTADLARKLTNVPQLRSVVGPINWELGGDGGTADWWHWEEDKKVEDCVQAYINQLFNQGKRRSGIILTHENNRSPVGETVQKRAQDRALEFIPKLVERLRHFGFRFVTLDSATNVASAQRSQGDPNSMPPGWHDLPRGERVHWHRVCPCPGYFFERSVFSSTLFWRIGGQPGEEIGGRGKEISGRVDDHGHVFLFMLGREAVSKLWYQAFPVGQGPSEWQEFKPKQRVSGLHRLYRIPENGSLKIEWWSVSGVLLSSEQVCAGSLEWSEPRAERQLQI